MDCSGIQGAGAEAAMHADDNPMLQQKMKPRHLHVSTAQPFFRLALTRCIADD